MLVRDVETLTREVAVLVAAVVAVLEAVFLELVGEVRRSQAEADGGSLGGSSRPGTEQW